MYRTTFEVTGRGSFPLDMLRYDQCFPSDTGSANNMARSGEHDAPQHDLPVVILCHDHADPEWGPTFARWASFGWGVTRVLPTQDYT
jgi:hypothetical protein